MEIFAERSVRIFYTLAAFTALDLIASPAFSASEVKTERVFVPEEKEKTSDPKLKNEPFDDFEIPADALPDIRLNHERNRDDEEDEDSVIFGPDPSPGPALNSGPPPPIMRDFSKLPTPVLRMRELILETAKKGKIENLRDLIGIGDSTTSLSIGGLEGDPIAHLKEASGDDDGYEILAILIEVLEAGYVHLNKGTDEEIYVWPYFFAWPFDKLTPEMNVELYRVLTAGDVEDSKSSGRYIFFRVGIKPDGQWAFFVAGD